MSNSARQLGSFRPLKKLGRAGRWMVSLLIPGGAAVTAAWLAMGSPSAGTLPTAAAQVTPPPAATAAAQFRRDIRPILQQFCYDCHADGAKSGQVAFDQLETDAAIVDPALWLRVLKNVRSGLMPPAGHPKPPAEAQLKLEQWIKTGSFASDPKNLDPGRVTVRRLNRTEYHNTLRDLLGIDFDINIALPPDDVGYGFDNIGDVLSISPMRMEKFIEAAISAVNQGVPMDTIAISTQMALPAEFTAPTGKVTGEHLTFYLEQKVSRKFKARVEGDYRIHIASKVDGEAAPDPQKVRVHLLSDDKEFFAQDYKWSDAEYFDDERVVHWTAGEHDVTFSTQPLLDLKPLSTKMEYKVLFVRVDGPLDRKQWEHPPGYSRFYTRDVPPENPAERRAYAREVLARFVPKAFRRPVPDETLDQLVALAEKNYTLPGVSFEKGIAQAIVAVLASPRFLFHLEYADPITPGQTYAKIDEYSLASRLSFALWCSVPDDELTRLASRGELRKNFDAQVKRMLADPKSAAFVESFSGQWLQSRGVLDIPINSADVMAQETPATQPATPPAAATPPVAPTPAVARAEETPAATGGTPPAPDAVAVAPQAAAPNAPAPPAAAGGRGRGAGGRGFGAGGGRGRGATLPPGTVLTPEIRAAMKQEVETYFAHIMHEDRSVLEFIQSDYTFVNSTLAPVYGIPNITSPDMQMVKLAPTDPRGGVITMGSILTVTSNPTRTSPVKRGKWILQNILGTPPAPPPPNIPALEDVKSKINDRQPTQRELLAIHRENPLCSSCHSRMDPLGLALENFNAFGRFRTAEYRQPIEATGELATGEKFNSVREMKQALVDKHRREFYSTITEKLLTYVLGRGTEYYDVATIDAIVDRMEKEDGRFSALLFGVLESAPFQQRRPTSHPVTVETPSSNQGGPAQ